MKTMIPISKLMPKYCELFGAIKFISNVVCGTPYNKNCESVQSKLERLLFHWVMFLSTLIVATTNLCYPVTVIIYIDGKSKHFILGFLIRPYDQLILSWLCWFFSSTGSGPWLEVLRPLCCTISFSLPTQLQLSLTDFSNVTTMIRITTSTAGGHPSAIPVRWKNKDSWT